ncbi:methyl-accepting chemotaxis protein [Microvirga massiliensis]|uniref:methyl-accepting chemotaxis protein n=1 Tax=Microvirga massiliensis TaxID=1033741 RepID=UPI00065FB1D1|nr:methyl-accepting chemotaxis protein [Microvirga massiliensis]
MAAAVISVLRRKVQSPEPARSAPPSEPPPLPEPVRSLDGEMIDSLEADVSRAIRQVTEAIRTASHEVNATRDDLSEIHGSMVDLVAAGRRAASQALGLAASTEELAAASGEITGAMNLADARIAEAVRVAEGANGLIAELARATVEIAGIVDTIAAVARQTNLLALNATIEAARAGSAGKGFAVVASEVKTLSVETGRAANDIRERIAHLRERAEASIGSVETVLSVIHDVRPVFTNVRTAVDEQNASLSELAARATEASSFVEHVSERAQSVDEIAERAASRITRADEAAALASDQAQTLSRRFIAVIRQNEIGDRRRYDRFPAEIAVRIVSNAASAAARTIDIGAGGLLLEASGGLTPQVGTILEADVERIGGVSLRVVAASGMGVHCAFGPMESDVQRRLDDVIAEIETGYRPLISAAKETARQMELALEQAVTKGRLAREALFDADYRPIQGTDPQQFETRSLKVLEDLLPAIQEPLLAADRRMVFCVAIDRNGYIPVHNRAYSQPQRPGDTVWNTANCRNRRIFDDRAGITAARSTRPFLVQSYAREMGGGVTVMMREVDVPIHLFGRHWGGFRTAYKL